jgi:hypothetical protein
MQSESIRLVTPRRFSALILIAIFCVGCGGNTPTSPTQNIAAAPPVVAPPPPPPPYSGVWSGNYIIEHCGGDGSAGSLFCAAGSGSRAPGIYPVGTSLPIRMDLTQSGSNVSGLVSFGSVRGVMQGVVRSNGLLSMQGEAAADGTTLRITYWDTRALSGVMDGFINYEARFHGIPGFAGVRTKLGNMRRE